MGSGWDGSTASNLVSAIAIVAPLRPFKNSRLDIYAVGTASIARVHILKDFRYVYTVEPKRREVRFRWQDSAVEKGRESWYYVRVEQEDGQLAWSSPIWVKYEP